MKLGSVLSMWMRASRLRSAAVPLLGGTAAAALYGLHSSTQACFVGSPASCEKDDGQLMGRSTERLIPAASRKRIAIYGGSFNPITNAHLNVAAEIMHSKLADEVWITPCGRRPDKPGLKTSMVHRLVMCHLAVDTTFGSRFGVKVCDEEADKPQAMPSIVLMRTLAQKYPEADFMFACGADQIVKVKEWTAPGEPGFWDEVPDAGEEFFKETHFLLIEPILLSSVVDGRAKSGRTASSHGGDHSAAASQPSSPSSPSTPAMATALENAVLSEQAAAVFP